MLNYFIESKTRYLWIFLVSFLIFFGAWFTLYKLEINSLPIQSEDIVPSVFTGISIVRDKTIYLDNYYSMMVSKYPQPDDASRTPFYLKKVGEHYLSAFPILSSIITLPIFSIYFLFVNYVTWQDVYLLSHLFGAFIMSLCSVLLYYFCEKILKVSKRTSLLVLLVYTLGTINLPLISQGLWQHGAVQLFMLLGLIYYFQNKYFETFLFLGFGILARPTAAIVILVLGIFMILNKELNLKSFLKSLYGILIPLGFFLLYNKLFYQEISNQGYSSQIWDSWIGNFPESFFGIWLAPSKGILIYSPVLLFSLISIYQGFKKSELLKISFWVILLHTLVISKWKHWYGGFGFGYRMISDILPFLVLPLALLLENYYSKVIKSFVVVLGISAIIQVSGLVFYDSIWHNAYDKGFHDTSWLWSLENSEAAFNIRRVLVKGGLLERACDICQPRK